MLTRIRQADREQGFTLIELLVVMIIIGILAAIAIPAFLGQKQKARDTSAKADVSVIGKEITAYYVDNSGGLAADSTTTAGSWTLKTLPAPGTVVSSGKLSSGNTVTSSNIVSDSAFCVSVQNGTTGKVYKYSQAGPGDGAC